MSRSSLSINTSDIDELFSEDDPYDGFSKYEEISRGRLRFNAPPATRYNHIKENRETDRKKNLPYNNTYPPPPSSPPRPFVYPTSSNKKRYDVLTSKINEDDGNNADNEKSVYLSSPLRPPLAPRRSPFHYSPSPEHYKERDDNEEKEIMDLLAHAPNVLNGRQSNTFHNDPKGYVDSPDDLKNISLVLQQKYTPPKLQQEIDPAIDDIIHFHDYIPPLSSQKNKDSAILPSAQPSTRLSSSFSSSVSVRSHYSPNPTPTLNYNNNNNNIKSDHSRISNGESFYDDEPLQQAGSGYDSSVRNVMKSPKKTRFVGEPTPITNNLDDEYIKLKKRELEKMHQDLLDFSYMLEEREVEIRKKEEEVERRLQDLHSEEDAIYVEEREKDNELSYLREHDKKKRMEIKQLKAKNIELANQINDLQVSNAELAQKLNLSDSRFKNFRDALNNTKEKNTELQKQNDELQLRLKKIETVSSPAPRMPTESTSIIHETLVALVSSICSLSYSLRDDSSVDSPSFKFIIPSLSVSLLGKLLPYVASKRDDKFQSSFLHLLFILLNQESVGAPNKYARLLPDLRPFEQSQDGQIIFFANLVILFISSNSPSLNDVTARALVALQSCVATNEGKEQFMKTDPMNTLLPLMRSKNRAILLPVVTLLLSMCSEGALLEDFLRRCSTEEWFISSAVALRSNIPDVIDHLCVILEKLSKISTNRGIFKRTGIRPILSNILLTNPDQFTRMNIVSTLHSLDIINNNNGCQG